MISRYNPHPFQPSNMQLKPNKGKWCKRKDVMAFIETNQKLTENRIASKQEEIDQLSSIIGVLRYKLSIHGGTDDK